MHANRAAHLAAPLVALAATIVVRRVLASRYRRASGDPVPNPRDMRVTFVRALIGQPQQQW
ncbi:MAG: hypothetical protein Q7K25_01420 [Actinomycetota bacterium]|nr:hypothetical protein [Actinomycetota bacterium]